MPSRKRCGSRSRYQRSLNVPGSPSSMFTAMTRGSGSAATRRHLRPAGKPAPPRPRSQVLHDLGNVLARPSAGEAIGDEAVAAGLPVLPIVDVLVSGHSSWREVRRRPPWPASPAQSGSDARPHGATSQRPTQGADITRTPSNLSFSRSSRAPASSRRDRVANPHGERLRRARPPSPPRSDGRRSPPRTPP